VPNAQLVANYRAARRTHESALTELVPLLRQMAMATLVDVIDGASTIEAVGELDEDWVPTLRIQRVLSADNTVLFDVETGHPDRAVEDAVDTVNVEYLDVLIDLTGDEYIGRVTID
jgi:hypothetical protein